MWITLLLSIQLLAAADGLPSSQQIVPVSVTASSHLPDWKGYTFGPQNLIDGRVDTSWQPRKSETWGAGSWIVLDLGKTWEITRLEIESGLQREDALGDLYCRNNKPHLVNVLFDDGAHLPAYFDVGDRSYAPPRFAPERGTDESIGVTARTRYLRFHVVTVQRPLEWTDLAIAEIRVFGRPAQPTPPPTEEIACGQPGWNDLVWAAVAHCESLSRKARRAAWCVQLIQAMTRCTSFVAFEDELFDDYKPTGDQIHAKPTPLKRTDLARGRFSLELEAEDHMQHHATFERTGPAAPWRVTSLACKTPAGKPCQPTYQQLAVDRSRRDPCFKKYPDKAKKAPRLPDP